MDRYPFQQWIGPYHLMNIIMKGTPPCGHFEMVSQTLFLTLNRFSSNPRSPRWFHFSFKFGKWDTQWVEDNKVNPTRTISSSRASFSLLGKHFSGAVQIWLRGTLEDWYIRTERIFGQDNYMVGCNIQEHRDIHSHNIIVIILWVVEGISLRPVRHILPIIPYLDNFYLLLVLV